ncbi:PQQ-dependent sugar dehydrogenase [Agromyces sp. CFH 90414]|uniref:PQQ-dependent sugar dehydrogenase n=1 Tax=Agromyces agglutinans TaxID=2662258 RepID=A0A6I2F659_9MICO|nr:PQQ-dependent sugar dehydrogenase [Agromyces agglutinans]MRG60182.1 PQQ-dependent sugar dehydrogenase [Agromyces agglutinans]
MRRRGVRRTGRSGGGLALRGLALRVLALLVVGPLAATLAACTGGAAPTPSATPAPDGGSSAPSSEPAAPTPEPAPPVLVPSGPVAEIATGLDAPWSVVRLPEGGVLVSERDTARILEVGADGGLRVVAEVPGVVPAGEGGLLGLAFLQGNGERPDLVYAAFTAADDNRVVRMPLTGAPGSLSLGQPEVVLTGIPKAGNHNGGRLAFGPDGFLYVTTGDAGQRDAAQDPASLAGKILRVTEAGAPAPGNPFGTHAWSIGHRNPQGLAWDADGRLWAAEFGQNTWDELNLVTRGANYGWPIVEGQAGDGRFTDPVAQWATSEASPSGLAIVGDSAVLASLRGERLWTVAPLSGVAPAAGRPAIAPTATAWFAGEFGRLRDVVPGPPGELWFLTNNTDGRGSPSAGDDRLLRVGLGGP